MHRDFPRLHVRVVELDAAVVAAARRWFAFPRSIPVDVTDGRRYLERNRQRHDVIVLDAYYADSIPFHLTTREFFQQVKAHLNPGGVIAVNVGRTATDYRLVDALASTMSAVFPSVLLLDDPNYTNTVVYASTEAITVDDVSHNLRLVSAPLAVTAAASALDEGKLRMSPYHGQVYTDDLAPIEQLIDEIIFGYLTNH